MNAELSLIPHFIDGRPDFAGSGETLPVVSPLDGARIGRLADAGPAGVERAVQAARRAFAGWGRTPVKERVQPLFRFKQRVEACLGELAERISRECGKTDEEARAEILRGLEVVEHACALPALAAGELLEVSEGVDCFTRRLPLGVVAGITPFNFPAMVPMWMFPLALASGNTFLLKPSELVPGTPLRLAELLRESGLPDGVFNVVQGGRVTGEALLDHPGIQAAAFVGSTTAARAVFQRGSIAGKRTLALGGAKNHVVILPDADPALVARNLTASATGCAGQRCMAASVAVAVGPVDPILDALADELRQVRAGVNLGAIISAPARDRIIGYLDRAARGGAELRLDGRGAIVPGREGGFYVNPSLVDRLSPDSECAREEIFGPVLSVLRVRTLDEALAIENASPYGNAASIYTASGAAARHFEQHARAGMIGINVGVPVPRDPLGFGGANESKFGVGDITGPDAIGFWTRTRKTTVKWSAAAAHNWMS
ncbi:MAG: CoA-acylating methylmalonate-semialdehyde dehydrogenase [Verrucomicrobiota bacterium]